VAPLLRDRYRLEARIGQGGNGAVYRARDLASDTTVAVKQVGCGGTDERQAVEREAYLLAGLEHPSLPRVSDFFVDGDDAFLVMTFVPGADLAQQLAQRGKPFTPGVVLGWADELLDALDYLHSRQPPIVHRDVKPRNIKIGAGGRAVLLDFGLARPADAVTRAAYTLRYAPLEQVRGQVTDPRADLFALGATLYELLARRSPIDAVERFASPTDPLVPLAELADGVPGGVAEVVTRALALHADARPATARAMRAALHEAIDGPVTVLAEPPAQSDAAPSLPRGTVTFFASEVVDESATPADLARHDGVLRGAIDAHGGFVFRFTSTTCTAAFATAGAAVASAVEAQRQLQLPVRMGVQSGAADFAAGDYVSHVLPRVGRLLATAHPRQIVVGSATRALMSGQTPDGMSLRDLGEHRLRDLPEPEHVFQVITADLPADFPPLQSPIVRGLPPGARQHRTIGRERELTEVVRHFRTPSMRLMTLVGPAGVGKTTLATLVGETLLDEFSGGVYFVPLASVRSADLVLPAIASAFGLPHETTLDTVASEVGDRAALVVIDNLEHLPAAVIVLGALLERCPSWKMVATSRVPLDLALEHVYAVQPLALDAAVTLFVERAHAIQLDLVFDEPSRRDIVRLCERLDALPLAIELAAARADLFSPVELLARVAADSSSLASRGGRETPHHQTLRAALAWSFDLLPSDEQRLFARLGAFVGGWDIEAAEAICAASDDSGGGVVRGLTHLVSHSLVRVADGPLPDTLRYSMLETVREYALERLQDNAIRSRHATYFTELAATGDSALGGSRMGAWVARLRLEQPNLRAALTWLNGQDEVDNGLRLAAALWRFWQLDGDVVEGRTWLEGFLQRVRAEPPSVSTARALVGAGALAWRAQDTAAAVHLLTRARAACSEVGERAALATTVKYLGVIALKGPPPDHAAAAELFETSLALRRELEDRDGIASCLNDLGVLARDLGEFARARRYLDESLDLCRVMGNRYGLSFVLNNLSLVALHEGAYERVPRLLDESLSLAQELGSREKIACALTGFASLAAVHAEPLVAARLFGAAEVLRQAIGVPMAPAEQAAHDRHLLIARAAVPATDWARALDSGRQADLQEVLADVNQFTAEERSRA
jgi:predicted ATPase